MGLVELALIAVGLAMDAFTVAICKGLGMARLDMRYAVVLALLFGGFQAGMPVLGWAVGAQFAGAVESVGHWIAFALLAFIGGKMIVDALRDAPDDASATPAPSAPAALLNARAFRELLLLAVATSIDALAVGVSFAFLAVDIAPAAALIGGITFALSFAGVFVGHLFGARWERPSAVVGGIVLILIGCKILLEHIGS